MKPAFKKDEAFLEDVRQVLNQGTRALWWLGQSAFLLAQKHRAMVLDPYLSDSLTRKYSGTDKPHVRLTQLVVAPTALAEIGVIDLITSSHNHTDHLDAETLGPLLTGNPQARLVIPAANQDFVLERLQQFNSNLGQAAIAPRLELLDDGRSAQIGEINISGVAAAHPTIERDHAGQCYFLGYVIQWAGLTVYHSGDTLWHAGLVDSLKAFAVDAALLPINGDRPDRRVAGNLDGPQAARLAHAIGAHCVVPCHFDLFEFNTAHPDAFEAECRRLNQPCHVLRNGERLDLDALAQ
jgi:L-ascorbate metabolism protein UlaG (beta-lactamase superfamily)